MSDIVGNPNCWFSYAKAHISSSKNLMTAYDIFQFLYCKLQDESGRKDWIQTLLEIESPKYVSLTSDKALFFMISFYIQSKTLNYENY